MNCERVKTKAALMLSEQARQVAVGNGWNNLGVRSEMRWVS